MIPIFDSLTHPTLSGKWFSENKNASINQLLEMVRCDTIVGFCAVGLSNCEQYDHASFFKMVSVCEKCFPVAGINPHTIENIFEELKYISSLGYKAIKLHPRIGCYNIDSTNKTLNACFEAASSLGLIIFLCTYSSSKLSLFPEKDPYWELVCLLKKFSEVKCILLHGGVARLMEYADLVRFNQNLLLDLSYTILKFKGASIDLDIKYLFSSLDQRICIGTDYPEYTITDLRERLKELELITPLEKLENIYYKNLQNFLGLT